MPHLLLGPQLLPLVVLGAVAVAFLVASPAMRRRQSVKAGRRASVVLLLGAILAVLVVTLPAGPLPDELARERSLNLVPGVEITRSLNLVNRDVGLLNVLGNIAMFVPIGFLTVLGLRSGIGSATMLGFVFSGSVESVQYVLGRVADIDDILLNTTGALLGAVSAVVLRRTAAALRRRRGTGSRPMAPSRR